MDDFDDQHSAGQAGPAWTDVDPEDLDPYALADPQEALHDVRLAQQEYVAG